ncbi:MAG TPA: tyrosine--tRNA ligase [Acidimicrobiales bacterium]|nr:tyrosine--tRNA ligase [Acidimicrobiales bacterium]
MSSLAADLRFRGVIHQVTDPAAEAALDRERLVCYIGFDPSAGSLHVGSLMQLCMLRRLQEAGHHPIAVAGGGTGMIGDPGGRSEERSLLTAEEVEANLAGIRPQVARFVDLGAGAKLVDNATWLGGLSVLGFLRDVGKHFTVNQMVAKESVRTRLEGREQGISYTEFSYMLLQAYDFLHLFDHEGCRLQVGGSDQWGNITAGIDLIRRLRGAEAWGLTTPLVVKEDGTKFGKTEAGTVWLDPARTSPYQLHQYLVQVEDTVVGAYLRYFTWLPHDRLEALDRAVAEAPEAREAQRVLAREVVALIHGEAEARRAEVTAGALFDGDLRDLDEEALLQAFAEAPSSELSRARLTADGGVGLADLLVETGLERSRSAARRTIGQGGAYVNNRREPDPDRHLGPGDLLVDRFLVLRRGRRGYHLVRVA